jgi:hypothetical protein
MRKLVATIAAAFALAGVGLATHTATSAAPVDTDSTERAGGIAFHILPYVEQENVY